MIILKDRKRLVKCKVNYLLDPEGNYFYSVYRYDDILNIRNIQTRYSDDPEANRGILIRNILDLIAASSGIRLDLYYVSKRILWDIDKGYFKKMEDMSSIKDRVKYHLSNKQYWLKRFCFFIFISPKYRRRSRLLLSDA